MYAYDVTQIEVRQHCERAFTQLILSEIELDLSSRIGKMSERRLAMRSPGNDAARQGHNRTFIAASHQSMSSLSGVLAIKAVCVRRYASRLQGFQFFAPRLEDKVELLGHAAAVVESPVCFRYASMNGSIAPSMTFWTSGIFSSVRWSLTIV